MEESQIAKVVLLGDSSVGKSSIVLRFVCDTFNPISDSTVGATFMSKYVQYSQKAIKFQIWDTAGQEKYKSLISMYYQDASAAVLVYDITNPSSFQGLVGWIKEMQEKGPPGCILAIAGNKEDLVETERVSVQKAQDLASSIGAVFRKTSAKTSFGIEQLFQDIALKLFSQKQHMSRSSVKLSEGKITTQSDSKDSKCCK